MMDFESWHLRMATPEDAPGVLEIYAPYVENTAVTFECVIPTVNEYAARMVSILKRYPFLVACGQDGSIFGYSYANYFKPRAAYDWTVESTVYLKPEARGCGISHALYDRLEDLLARQGITNMCACIAIPNPSSVAFHLKRGFKEVAHFSKCGYKLGIWLDMIWVEKNIAPYSEHPEPIVAFPDLEVDTSMARVCAACGR